MSINVNDITCVLFQETVSKFSKMSDLECKNYIMDVKNDKSINEKLKKNLLSFYICAYKTVIKNKLHI